MAAFTPGNIVVYRVGGTAADGPGTSAPTSSATQVFIDEYTPTGTYVQTIALPTMTSGSNSLFTDSGTATSAGLISDSNNGSQILAEGYADPLNSTKATSSTVPRVVGIVSANGTVDTSTTLGSYDSANNARSAASDGTNIFVGGGAGIGQTTGGSTAAPTVITSDGNTRQTQVVGGNLYYSTSSTTGSGAGIYSLGSSSAPATTGTLLAASANPYGFFLTHLGATGTAPDTLYVADGTSGIEKFSLNAQGTFVASGTVALANVTGLTGIVTNGSVQLFATTPSSIMTLPDSSGQAGTLAGTPTQLVAAPANTAFHGDALAPQVAACYRSGTRILTVEGEVAIEDLRVGDLVVTSGGSSRPIEWIGHRRLECRTHADPAAVLPIRIAAGSIATHVPNRDLWVSPGHAICVDVLGELLMPAVALVGCPGIARIEVADVTYWHVELDSHDLLIADGLPSESYLDTGNRAFFVEGGLVALRAVPDRVGQVADYCRPFVADGPIVAAVRARLTARGAMSGVEAERLAS